MKLRINENPLHEKLERISENFICMDYAGDYDMHDYCQKFGISESVEKIDDVLVFDYVGDVVNTIINKPRVYRICYDPRNDVYGLGDAYKYIHSGIEKLMKKLGYEPEPSKEGTYNYKEITFVPYDVKDDKWQVGGFVGERDKAVYIPSGFLLYNRVTSPEDYIPDLYDVLKRRGLILKHLNESQIESIKKTAQKRLNDCYRRFDEITDIYEDNGFKLTDPDFHGYEDFKSYSDYFIKNPKSWGFGPDFDGLFVDTVPGRNMRAFDLYIGEGDDQVGVYWIWSDVMSSQSAIYKELMNLCKDYNIPYSTFYDL